MKLIFLVIIIILFFVKYKRSNFGNQCENIKIDKFFLINLKDSIDRRKTFLKSFKKLKTNIPLQIIDGINTSTSEKAEKYRNMVNPIKFKDMFKYDSGELIRPDHSYLNPGALGCYLSHMEFYKECFKQKLNYAVCFEDNVILSSNFINELNQLKLPSNFDVCFLHAVGYIGYENETICDDNIKFIKIPLSAKCYLINVNNMKKYYDLFYLIDGHADRIYEKLSYNGAKIYLREMNSIKIEQKFNSTIKHTSVLNNSKNSFYYDKEFSGIYKGYK